MADTEQHISRLRRLMPRSRSSQKKKKREQLRRRQRSASSDSEDQRRQASLDSDRDDMIGLLTRHQYQQIKSAWRNAKTWHDILDLNRSFLRGDSPGTVYHLSPLLMDSKLLEKQLLELHDYGFLTVNGQGPADYRGYNDRSGLYYHIKQRPYLIFAAPRDSTPSSFLRLLIRDPRLFCTIINLDTGNVCSNQVDGDGREVVTIEKGAKNEKDLEAVPWQPATFQPAPYNSKRPTTHSLAVMYMFRAPATCPAAYESKPFYISVAFDGHFGEPFALEEHVINVAAKSGMKKLDKYKE